MYTQTHRNTRTYTVIQFKFKCILKINDILTIEVWLVERRRKKNQEKENKSNQTKLQRQLE